MIKPAARQHASWQCWRPTAVALAVGLAAVVALYWQAVEAAVTVWIDSSTYRSSFFVIPVSLYFIWLRRADIADLTPRPFFPALAAVFLFGAVGLVADAADVMLGRQLAAVGVMQALILTVLGWRIFRALLFPLLFLWMLVPAGDFLLPSLMRLVTASTVAGVQLAGLGAEAEGNLIRLGTEMYSVVEECAALDFLIGALMISLVYGNLMYRGTLRRTLLVVAALAIAVGANIFRTTTVVLITHFSQREIDLASDHQTYGWVVFLIATIALMWAGFLFREPVEAGRPGPHDPIKAADRPAPVIAAAAAAVAVAVAVAVSAYGAFALRGYDGPDTVALCLPADSLPWRGGVETGGWRPVIPSAGGHFQRSYSHRGQTVDLHVAYFTRQEQGAELVGWGNRIADGRTWFRIEQGAADIRIDGDVRRAIATRMGRRGQRRLAWHWYWIDGAFTASRAVAKLLQARARLFGGDTRAALVAVSAVESGGEGAATTMQAFLDAAPPLRPVLESAGAVTEACPGS